MKRHILRLAGASALILAICIGWAAWLQSNGNFHAVLPGELYRSGQPSGAMLDEGVARTVIRSVVNLRGPSRAGWYRDEVAAAARLSLAHADFAMRDDEMLTPARAAELVALIRAMPQPVLIHCKAGADRTGLAAALYLAATGRSEEAAERQISFRYGHIGLPGSAAWPMNLSWEAMEPFFQMDS